MKSLKLFLLWFVVSFILVAISFLILLVVKVISLEFLIDVTRFVSTVKGVIKLAVNMSIYDLMFRLWELILILRRLIFAIFIASIFLALILMVLFNSLSDLLLLKWYNAKLFYDRRVYKIVDKLSKKAGIKRPKVYITDLPIPNAFALGGKKRGKIILTRELLNRLDEDELEAVIAHEIVHIKNDDVTLAKNTTALIGILLEMPTLAYLFSLLLGFGREDDLAPNLVRVFVLALIAPVAALVINFMLSGKQEFLADVQSVELHGNKDSLINALTKIEAVEYTINVAHGNIFTVNPVKRDWVKIGDIEYPTYNSIFNIQPSVEDRIRVLKGEPVKVKKPKIYRYVFYSFVSHIMLMFGVIVYDIFRIHDFDIMRVVMISAIYIFILLLLILLFLVIFHIRRRRLKFP